MGGTSYIIYFILIVIIPIVAQMKVKSAFAKYSKVASSSRVPGHIVARQILDSHGLYDVTVHQVPGKLSDHYDPRSKTVNLSPDVYNGYSLAATAVAAHEVGHAIQHSQSYPFLELRSKLVPIANFGSNFSWIFIIIGMLSSMSGFVLAGILFMLAAVVFQLVTLPVEFNASSRAMDEVVSLGIIRNDEERATKKVLSAAALTYVAAAAVAVMELLRLVLIYTGMTRDE